MDTAIQGRLPASSSSSSLGHSKVTFFPNPRPINAFDASPIQAKFFEFFLFCHYYFFLQLLVLRLIYVDY